MKKAVSKVSRCRSEDKMNRTRILRCSMLCLCFLVALIVAIRPAHAQDEKSTGTVVSLSRTTITIRTTDGRYQLFTLAPGVKRPPALAVGSQVEITSSATDDSAVRSADEITILQAPPSAGSGTSQPPVVPPEVRGVERDIERAARRYQLGVRAGVALDPELIMIGVSAQVGPFFNPNVFLRPNAEFAYGEVTALFSVNPEVIYRLPFNSRQGRRSTYVGIGPGFNFTHQKFQGVAGSSRIDFSDFSADSTLNILGGVRYRSGMFAEIKTSIYANPSPVFRLIIGYNF
jgi:hypothetical protein